MKNQSVIMLVILTTLCIACGPATSPDANGDPENDRERVVYSIDEFVMGVDLSYVNQILDHGGVYRDSAQVKDPYRIFADYGVNMVRLRKWHNPQWTKEIYNGEGRQLYNDLFDVEKSVWRSRDAGMAVTVNFHYSDMWADPGRQEIPAAWMDIDNIDVLKDSVYNYTYESLMYLAERGLMPEMVQVGNETNCGLMYTNAPDHFPSLNGCDGHWENLAAVINSGIRAVRDASEQSEIQPKIKLHIAQPENAEWWFDAAVEHGVTDFDIIGLSYYSNWSDVPLQEIGEFVNRFTQRYNRDVMIVETAYSWTMESSDDYNNIYGPDSLIPGYPATPEGQKQFMLDLTQQVIDGGGTGVIYWEPAWITSDMRDLWGQGSSWENNAFFDFDGNPLPVFDYLTWPYDFHQTN